MAIGDAIAARFANLSDERAVIAVWNGRLREHVDARRLESPTD